MECVCNVHAIRRFRVHQSHAHSPPDSKLSDFRCHPTTDFLLQSAVVKDRKKKYTKSSSAIVQLISASLNEYILRSKAIETTVLLANSHVKCSQSLGIHWSESTKSPESVTHTHFFRCIILRCVSMLPELQIVHKNHFLRQTARLSSVREHQIFGANTVSFCCIAKWPPMQNDVFLCYA